MPPIEEIHTDQPVSKVQRNLTALIEFSRVVNSSRDLDFTLNNLLFGCLGKFLTTRGFVVLRRDAILKIVASKGMSSDLMATFPEVSFEESEDILAHPKIAKFLSDNSFTLYEKIVSPSRCMGFIALGERPIKLPYSEEEQEFLKTIVNIAATGVENSLYIHELKKVNKDLDKRMNRLNSLFELSYEFGILTEETRIGRLFLYALLGNFMVSSYAIVYKKGGILKVLESTKDKVEIQKIFDKIDIQTLDTHAFKNEIVEKYPELESFGFEIMVPMKLQNDPAGAILLGKRINNTRYFESDLEFIYSIGSLAISALENKRLFAEALEKQRMEEELEVAKGIQKNLLPKEIPTLEHIEIAAKSISSKQVGGDYYDVIKLDEDRIITAIADVSGKGVPASLLMANLQAFLKSICKQDVPLPIATATINDLVTENTTDGKFITFFWAVIDQTRKKFHYVNAGHNPPLLLREGEITYLDKGGMILGVMETMMPYQDEEIDLKSGDLIVMFTDGVTEAKNIYDDEFEDERFEELVKTLGEPPAEKVLSTILSEVEAYSRGVAQSDDITLVIIKVR